jgi:hypothetical protein
VTCLRPHLAPDLIDRTVRKYVREIGPHRGFSAQPMRATFITLALDNGASLEGVQRAGGHAAGPLRFLFDLPLELEIDSAANQPRLGAPESRNCIVCRSSYVAVNHSQESAVDGPSTLVSSAASVRSAGSLWESGRR